MYINTCIYGCIWLYIYTYVAFRCPRGAQNLFTVHLQPESWCAQHQAETAIVQHHPTSMHRVVAPAQLPRHAGKQLNKVPYR